jgi:hypothetical protein
MKRWVVCAALAMALLPRAAVAQSCGAVRFVGTGKHVENEHSRVEFPIFVYEKDGRRAVVVKQDMRVNADGAVRSYAVDNHGFSYLCDGLTWKSPGGFTSGGDCRDKANEAMRLATREGDVLRFSAAGPTLCVFGFHVEGGDSGCNGMVVGGGAGGRAPLVQVATPQGPQAHFVATTAVKNSAGAPGTPQHEVDSATIPFIVRPGKWEESHGEANFGLRDYAYVYSPGDLGVGHESLHGARGVFAVVGDSGPKNKFGEGSIALHQYLAFGELHPAPSYEPTEATARHPHAEQIFHPFVDKRGGDVRAKMNIDHELWYVIFPGSADGSVTAHTYARDGVTISGNVQENGVEAASAMGGIDAVIACLAADETFRSHVRH